MSTILDLLSGARPVAQQILPRQAANYIRWCKPGRGTVGDLLEYQASAPTVTKNYPGDWSEQACRKPQALDDP